MRQIILLLSVFAFSGCAWLQGSPAVDVSDPNALYRHGMEYLEKDNYQKAIESFEKIQSDYPFYQKSQEVQRILPYLYYKEDKLEQATLAIDRYESLFLDEKSKPYFLYLRGRIAEARVGTTSVVEGLLDDEAFEGAERDYGSEDLRQAKDYYKRIISGYAQTKYAADAFSRIAVIDDHLANRDYLLAMHYKDREYYVAAVNRLAALVNTYPKTKVARKALDEMVTLYRLMGMEDVADKLEKAVTLNNPSPQS